MPAPTHRIGRPAADIVAELRSPPPNATKYEMSVEDTKTLLWYIDRLRDYLAEANRLIQDYEEDNK
jgi:hypothetical protein